MGPNINVLILPRFALSWLFTSVMINFDDRMTHWWVDRYGTSLLLLLLFGFSSSDTENSLEMLTFRDQRLDLIGFPFWFLVWE